MLDFYRLFFTTFSQPAPSADVLNKLAAEPSHRPLVRARSRTGISTLVEEDASYYYFCIDEELLYFSFAQDWGPLNLAMVYKACILIHEHLEVCCTIGYYAKATHSPLLRSRI